MELRPYQQEAVEAIFEEWKTNKSTMIVLPTGCGKTVIFSEVARQLYESGKRILMLAHRGELLEQTQDKFLKFGVESVLEKAESKANPETDNVVVASVQSISRDNRLSRFPKDYFDVIIIDECHHAATDTYTKVIEYFNTAKLLGVTATPNRSDVRSISDVFDTVAYSYDIKTAIDEGYLSPIKIRRIPIKIDISGVRTSCGDFMSGDLGNAIKPYLKDIAQNLKDKASGRKTLIFTPTIAIGEEFASLLNDEGFKASCVSSNNSADERKDIANKLSTGELNAVTNAMLWTEGFDEPSIDCIINLRATKSESLYRQIIGRGLRLSPDTDKDNLLVLDFLWHSGKGGYNILSPIQLFVDESRLDLAEDIINEGEEEDLLSLEEKADARAALIKQMEEAKRKAEAEKKEKERIARQKENDKNRHFFFGRELKNIINTPEITYCFDKLNNLDSIIFRDAVTKFYTGRDSYEYIPLRRWESEPATEKQKEALKKYGFDISTIRFKGLATALMNAAIRHFSKHKCSYKQYVFLTKHGFKNVENWSMKAASDMMDMISRNGWRVPRYINPRTYKPANMMVFPDRRRHPSTSRLA